MPVSAATVELVLALVPTAVQLSQGVMDAVTRLADEGYEVPGIDDLRATNEALRKLPDLSTLPGLASTEE